MGKFKRLGFENFTFHNSSLQFSEKTRIWGAGVVRQRAEFAPLRSGGCGDGKLLTSSASTDPRGTYRLLSATVCVRGIGRTGSTGRAKPGADAGSVCLVRAWRDATPAGSEPNVDADGP